MFGLVHGVTVPDGTNTADRRYAVADAHSRTDVRIYLRLVLRRNRRICRAVTEIYAVRNAADISYGIGDGV